MDRLIVRSAVTRLIHSYQPSDLRPAHDQTPLIVIRGTSQQYFVDILRTPLLPFLLQYPGLIFQQDNARPHTARVSMNCLAARETLPWLARSLSNRACLGYDGKATASSREYW
ncbi:transposable element Tc1 transposase [Trichonephila clavipes]|nr:transposable element Tc1 transposase [Trichonephila clavipes]